MQRSAKESKSLIPAAMELAGLVFSKSKKGMYRQLMWKSA
jgi:hypothetical protein